MHIFDDSRTASRLLPQRLIDFRFASSITGEHSFQDFPSLWVSHKKVFHRNKNINMVRGRQKNKGVNFREAAAAVRELLRHGLAAVGEVIENIGVKSRDYSVLKSPKGLRARNT
jgi:hypothetical protein